MAKELPLADMSQFGGDDLPAADMSQFEPAKPTGVIRKLADLGLGFASGALGATQAVADVAGAGNPVSDVLDRLNQGSQELLSPEAQSDLARQQEILSESRGKGAWEGVKSGVKAFGVAPVQTAVTGLGSVVPTIAAGMATGGASVPATLAAMGAMGAAQGMGSVKGGIYEEIKKRSLDAGMSESDAEAAAVKAQEYSGPNTANIAVGGALGAADAATGVTKAATSMLRRATLGQGAKIAEGSTRGLAARTAIGAAGEVPLESAQGGQQQYAQNVAAQRAGFETDSMDDVASQAVFQGLASAGPGAAFGAVHRAPSSQPAPAVQPESAPPAPQAGPLTPPTVAVDTAGQPVIPEQPQGRSEEVANVEPTQTPAEAMGLDASTGPLSKAAVHAVNSGLTQTMADNAQAAADEQAKGKEQTEGSFKTSDEAKKYISTQKRAGGASIQALPMPKKDGSFGIAIKGSPDYEIAAFHQKQETLRAAGVLDGDILTKSGDIFPPKQRGLAAITAKRSGKGFEAVPVAGGFVVRRAPESKAAKPVTQKPKERPASAQTAQTIKDQPPAPATQTSAVKAAGVAPTVAPAASQAANPSQAEIDAKADEIMRLFDKMGGGIAITRDQVRGLIAEKGMEAAEKSVQAFRSKIQQDEATGAKLAKMKAATPETEIDAAAHTAATSPLNDLPQPTQAQKEAGNYAKGHVNVQGLDISIENPQGSTRSGKRPDGSTWEHVMSNHYGYIKRTVGADEEQVDVYVGPKPDSAKVFVVDQLDQQTGKFDEHKAMLGFSNQMQAASAYRSNFDKGWKVGPIKAMSMDEFKAWLKEGDTAKPATQPAKTVVKAEVKEPVKPKKTNKMAEARTELLSRRAAYFTPGNIVAGYSGFDEVLSYSPPDKNGDWSVKVHEVKKVGDQWVRQGKPQDARQHSTQPTAQQLARGPVDQLGSRTAAEVEYSEPRADGKPFPNAAPRGAPSIGIESDTSNPSIQQVESLGKTGERNKSGDRARGRAMDANPFKAFIAKHGISGALASEFAPGVKERRAAMVQGYGPVFRKSGMDLDRLAQNAVEEGFLKEHDVTQLSSMIHDVLRGKRIIAQYAHGVAETEMADRAARAAEIAHEADQVQNSELEAEAQAEREAIQAVQALSDETLQDLAEDETLLTAGNNVSEAEFLRAMGATEQEISDAIAKESARASQGDQGRAGAEETAAGATPIGAEGSAGQAHDEGLTTPTFNVKLEAGQNTLHSNPQFHEAEAQAKTLPKGQYSLITVDRAGLYTNSNAEPTRHGAWVSNGDGTATFVAKSFPASREPLTTEDIAALHEAATKNEQGQKEKISAANQARLNLIESRQLRIGTEWAGAQTYVAGKTGITTFSKSKITGIGPDGFLTVESTLRGSNRLYKFTVDANSRLFDNYPSGEGLTTPTRQDILAQQDRAAAGARAETQAKTEAEQRAQADAERGDFALTGSNREADQAAARGQESLFAKELTPAYTGSYETDLFGNPVPSPAGKNRPARSDQAGIRGDVHAAAADTPAPRADYYVNTIIGTESSRELGADRILSAEQAAQATQYLYKSAVERLDGIVTDKNGKPLAVIGGFKGAVGQTAVYPATLMGEAIRIPGAAHVWFSHNHPSGTSTLSNADVKLNAVLSDTFRGSGIKPMGMLAVAGDKFSHIGPEGEGEYNPSRSIPPPTAKKMVPVMERKLAGGQTGDDISSPEVAKSVAKVFYDKAKEPGIILLNSQNAVVGWLPISKEMMGPLRNTGGAASIYRAVSQSNATGAVIVHGGELDSTLAGHDVTISQNIASALNKVDVRALDSINTATGTSMAERGLRVVEGPMFAIGGVETSDFARAIGPARGMTVAATQKVVDKVASKWKNGPRIVVVAATNDLPAQVKARVKGNPRGIYTREALYIVAGNNLSADWVARTLAHEAIAHHGLRGLLGQMGHVQLMRRIHAGIAAGDKLLLASQNYVRDTYAKAKLSPKDEADEIAAHVVEMAVDPVTGEFKPGYGWLKMTFARIAAFLRKIGIDVKFTLAELHGMLVSSMKNLETGQRTMGGGEFVVASARREDAHLQADGVDQTETPAFKKWFGDSKVVDDQGQPLVVYHGTASDNITEFLPQATGNVANTERSKALVDWFRRLKSENGRMGYMSFRSGTFFSPDPKYAGNYTGEEGGVMYPVYIKAENPVYMDQRTGKVTGVDPTKTPDALIMRDGNTINEVAVLDPTQIKSAIGNRGTFDASNPDILMALGTPAGASAFANAAVERINSMISAPGKVNWWHKSLGTMYNLAERSPAFKPVFEAAQNFINDVSFYATEAADLAPRILPKLETWSDIKKSPISAADNKAVSTPIFEGTLSWARDESGKPVKVEELEAQAASLTPDQKAQRLLRNDKVSEQVLKMWRGLPVDQFNAIIETKFKNDMLKPGVVFTDAELKSLFNLTPEQITLYREFRTATDKSLDNLAKADMLRYGGEDVKALRDQVMAAEDADAAATLLRDYLLSLAKEDPARSDVLTTTASGMIDRADKVQALKKEGYAPLSRFGQYTVDVVVDGERQYFSLFESAHAANTMANKMRMLYGKGAVTQGTLSNEAFKLFAGITPESLELFGNMLGLDSTGDQARDKVFQDYLKLTKTNRSAMRRLIHRKGIAGYSEDAGRVLASFVYSNARQTSAALHMGDLGEAITEIPKEQGELTDVAVKLSDYIKNPQEEAHAVRGLLFAQYLGGSIASAAVNMTQPLAVSLPYLSQFGGIVQSGRELARAYRDMVKKNPGYEVDLAAALKHAEETGIVSPQEVHQLMAQARGSGSLKSGDGTRAGNALAMGSNALSRLSLAWGKVFGMAEQLNRRTTFIAAYRIAKAQGMANPAGFAEKAVNETQFVYNKANKMQFGRGAIGGTLMTFKTYSISYLELMHRMYTQGGPEGKKAALLGIAVLLLLSGAGGLPFAEDVEDLVDGVLQRLGYNISSKKAKQEFLEGIFGKAGAEFIDRGITGLPGVPLDVSGRLGMGNLIPGTGMFTEKRSHAGDLGEFVGPMGDFVKRLYEGGGQLLSGDVGKATLTVAPTAVRNVAKGVDMASSGMYRDTKGYKVLDTTDTEAALKAIGFQPASVSQVQQANYLTQKAKDFYNMTAQDIRARWAKGIFEKDRDQVEQARAMLDAWNRNNPEQRMNANLPAIMKKAREMAKSKEQRIADTAPKAMRMQLRQDISQRRVEAQ